jgi:AraC-like DNA-binding protein
VISGPTAHAIGELNATLLGVVDDMSMRAVVRRRAALFNLLEVLLSTCPDPERGFESLREAERIAPALAAIEELIDDADLTVRTLALRCRLSPSRFHALFRAALGVGPVRYLQQRRMARAEQLLLSTTERIRDVAVRSGYADEFHFSRLFKRLHGLSPLAYREQTARHGA